VIATESILSTALHSEYNVAALSSQEGFRAVQRHLRVADEQFEEALFLGPEYTKHLSRSVTGEAARRESPQPNRG
jgi:hypothetical protein